MDGRCDVHARERRSRHHRRLRELRLLGRRQCRRLPETLTVPEAANRLRCSGLADFVRFHWHAAARYGLLRAGAYAAGDTSRFFVALRRLPSEFGAHFVAVLQNVARGTRRGALSPC